MTHLILCFALLCMGVISPESNSMPNNWTQTSPCSYPALGWSGANPVNNVSTHNIDNWDPKFKYIFHGGLTWNTMGNTVGEIILKKEGTTLKKRIADWSNPPGRSEIEQDITQYIDGNGTYFIEWKFMSGISGVCILKSDITRSPLK